MVLNLKNFLLGDPPIMFDKTVSYVKTIILSNEIYEMADFCCFGQKVHYPSNKKNGFKKKTKWHKSNFDQDKQNIHGTFKLVLNSVHLLDLYASV